MLSASTGLTSSQTASFPSQVQAETSAQSSRSVFRQMSTAEQLLQSFPIKYKKMLRRLIEEYEEERMSMLQFLKSTPNTQLEVLAYRQRIEQMVKETSTYSRELHMCEQRERLLKLQIEQLQLTTTKQQQEINRCYQALQNMQSSLQAQHELQGFMSSDSQHIIQSLDIEFKRTSKKLDQQIKDNKQLAEQNRLLNQQISTLQMKVEQEKKLRMVEEQKANTLQKQLRKRKVVEIRQTMSRSRDRDAQSPIPNLEGNDMLKSSFFRKASEGFSPKLQALNLKPSKPSINESIRKTKELLSKEKSWRPDESSEPDSLEFGKEKVIEKKKMRKLLGDLVLVDGAGKKGVLEVIAAEIGLKEQEVENLSRLF